MRDNVYWSDWYCVPESRSDFLLMAGADRAICGWIRYGNFFGSRLAVSAVKKVAEWKWSVQRYFEMDGVDFVFGRGFKRSGRLLALVCYKVIVGASTWTVGVRLILVCVYCVTFIKSVKSNWVIEFSTPIYLWHQYISIYIWSSWSTKATGQQFHLTEFFCLVIGELNT